jgi:hypothetical protein
MKPRRPAPVAVPPPPQRRSAIVALHARIRDEIASYSRDKEARKQAFDIDLRDRREASSKPQLMAESKVEVGYSCRSVDRLVDQLLRQAKEADEIADAKLVSGMQADTEEECVEDVDLLDDVATLRMLASEDTSLETTSVADYGADPPPAPGYSTSSITAIVEELRESHRKMRESTEEIRGILAQAPHWWTSPIVMRRLKTHAIRMNYHARKFRKWGNQCRAHLFVSSSILNRAGNEGTVELRDLRGQLGTYEKRRERFRQRRVQLLQVAGTIEAAGSDVQTLAAKLADPLLHRSGCLVQEVLDAASLGSDDTPTPAPPTPAKKVYLTEETAETVLLLAGLKRSVPKMGPHIDSLTRYLAVSFV